MRTLLDDDGRHREINAIIAKEATAFARTNRDVMRPTWSRAAWTLGKSTICTVMPLAAAMYLADRGHWWVAFALVPFAGMALFGMINIVHDTVHSSFVPSRVANRWVGRILAPIFFYDHGCYRRSHLEHHRVSQAIGDPKRPKHGLQGEDSMPDLRGPLLWLVKLLLLPMRIWLAVAVRLLALPRWLRQVFYIATMVVMSGPMMLLFGGDPSLTARDWKRAAPWLSAAGSGLLYVTIGMLSSTLVILLLASVWFALSMGFLGFLTHLTPYQIYMEERDRSTTRLLTLNISDVRIGPLTRFLGNGAPEAHCAHHMFPYVPCYALEAPARWIDERFAPLRAASVNLLSIADGTFVWDAVVSSYALPEEQGWQRLDTATGAYLLRLEHVARR